MKRKKLTIDKWKTWYKIIFLQFFCFEHGKSEGFKGILKVVELDPKGIGVGSKRFWSDPRGFGVKANKPAI